MAEVKGPLTTLSHALPSGLDGTRLAQWRLRDGRSYDQVRADIAASFDGVNRTLLARWGDLISVTFDDHFEYPDGGAQSDMIDITDLDRIEPKRGSTKGHMIDLRVKGDGIGGTHRFFRDARESVLTATIQDIVQRGTNTFEKAVLTRALTTTANALGSSGYDLPFANASSGVTWTPPAYGGQTFLSSHTHYVGYDSDSLNAADALDGSAKHISEHGYAGPYTAYVAEADVATYRGLTNYVRPNGGSNIVIVDRGGQTSGSNFFSANTLESATPEAGGRYIGDYDSPYGRVRLLATYRIPTGYHFMYKSFGMNDPRNPIAVRVHPDVGFGFYLKEIPSNDTTWPVKQIDVEIEYGISVGRNRLIGAAGFLHEDGAYVNPVIS